MSKIFKNKYDIVILGDNFFSTQLALQLSFSKKNILFISQKDIAENYENLFIDLSNYNDTKNCKQFYNNYSHSLVPANLYNVYSTGFLSSNFKRIESVFNKNIIDNKSFAQIEKAIKINKKSFIKKEGKYKINYSRLCVDTLKTAIENGIDFINYTKIKTIEANKIVLQNEKIINAELIINCDINLINSDLQNKISKNKYKFFSIPKQSLQINNPIRIIDKNNIDLIPYFSELFIVAKKEQDNDKIINTLLKNTGFKLNKNIIITDKIVNNYSSDILIDKTGTLNIFESNYTLFQDKINTVLESVCTKFSIEKYSFKNFKIAGSFNENIDKYELMRMVEDAYLQVQETGINPNEYTVLFYRYGKNIEKITDKAYDYYNNKETRKNAWLYAELWYCINHEFVKTFNDFTERRTNFSLINQLDNEKTEIITNFIENAK